MHTESKGFPYFRAPLRRSRDVAQLVEYASGGRVVAGSSPVIPTFKRTRGISSGFLIRLVLHKTNHGLRI